MPTMRNEMNPNDPMSLWQDQEVEKVTLTIDEVRSRAARFEQRIHGRNMRKYLAGAFVIAIGLKQLWLVHGWRVTPPVMAVVGTIYVMFQFHRRASTRTLPVDVGLRASIEFHRVELERQRDVALAKWHWYLLPFVPSLAGALIVSGIDHGISARWIEMAVVSVLIFVGALALNRRDARKLDGKIEELKAMETDHE